MIYFKITISAIIHNFTSEKKRVLISSEVDFLDEKSLNRNLQVIYRKQSNPYKRQKMMIL